MRTFVLAVVILVIIITGCLFSTNFINAETRSMQDQLTKLEKQLYVEDWDKARTEYKNFKSQWNEIHPIWSMLIDHNEIDYINMDLSELEAFIINEDKTNALAKTSSLHVLVGHIPEKEYLTLRNIF